MYKLYAYKKSAVKMNEVFTMIEAHFAYDIIRLLNKIVTMHCKFIFLHPNKRTSFIIYSPQITKDKQLITKKYIVCNCDY